MRHYFKTAWRTLKLNKTYSVTNLIGLTIGLIVVMLLTSRIVDELSYDRHWTLSEELYAFTTVQYGADGNPTHQYPGAPGGIAQHLTEMFPDIEDYTHIHPHYGPLILNTGKDDQYIEAELLQVDTNFFNLFDVQAVSGNPKRTVAHMDNLIISESLRKRYFAGEDVVGKIIYDIPQTGDPTPYIVTAVVKDLPQNSHFHSEIWTIIPHETVLDPHLRGNREQYLQIAKNYDSKKVEAKINDWYQKQQGESSAMNSGLQLQSIKDLHLTSKFGWDSPMRDVYVLIGVAVLVTILMIINFINLTFANTIKRTQDIGIRRVLGADKRHLRLQLGTESFLLFGVALVIAMAGYILIIPVFERFLEQSLTMVYHRSPGMLIGLGVVWLGIGLVVTLFPVAVLERTKTTQQLKKSISILRLPLNIGFTKTLIVIQFGIAMLVVICMLTIRSQIDYMDQKDLGYQPQNLLSIDYTGMDGNSKAFKQRLLQYPEITSVSITQWSPFSGSVDIGQVPNPKDPEKQEAIVMFDADVDLAKTLGLKLVEGRLLSLDHAMDVVVFDEDVLQREIYANALVTESTFETLGLTLDKGYADLKYNPVGIIKDFNGASLRFPTASFLVRAIPDNMDGCVLIRAEDGKEKEAELIVANTWKEFFPHRIVKINRIEDQVRNQYTSERKMYQQLLFFSSISMIIAFLGAFGIVIYTVERRIKEIGIRKVLGASASSIVALLSSSFAKLILLSTLLAFPIAWWLMKKWLENFAFRIDIPLMLFIFTAVGTFFGMVVVVGFKALHAARANPVESLRDE